MQAYLPVFPPLFPGYGVERCLFEVSHTTKQSDALRCVDVPGFKESFYLGYGVESCGFCYVSVRAVLTSVLKVFEVARRQRRTDPLASFLCLYVRVPSPSGRRYGCRCSHLVPFSVPKSVLSETPKKKGWVKKA